MILIEQIHQTILAQVKKIFPLIPFTAEDIEINLNTDHHKQEFGDLTTNAALVIAQKIKQNPRAIAEQIIAELKYEYIDWVEIAGPGFINLFLTTQALQVLARELYQAPEAFFKLNPEDPKTSYLIEFVSANPTGPLHVGHGRGGIIGDVLGTLLKFLGHQVIKEFYINDAGAQMQKLGQSLKIRCQQQLKQAASIPEDGYQGEYLVELAQKCIQENGEKVIEKPESFFTDYAYRHLLENIKKTLTEYGITFDVWFSEKTLHDTGAIEKALAILQKNGYLYEKEGALWFTATQFGDDKDRVVRKNTGELTYVAADVAYLLHKLERVHHLIMVLGQDHHSYVVRLKAVLQGLGKSPDILDVILYQLVTLKESGQFLRMSKRAGRMVTLEDITKAVGKDVARFFYLNRKADAHLDFDIDLALQHTEENPVYYIQYAYVRTGSIIEKAQTVEILQNISAHDCIYLTDNEKLLLKKIVSLKELLKNISHNYQTHLLTYYVIELAHQFHRYYTESRVIDPAFVEQSRGRLVMITLLRNTFALCFNLLGISCPEKM
ncbi:MAG: arginine--tRNA ligase [Candidatus Babeliaceae bacterium]